MSDDGGLVREAGGHSASARSGWLKCSPKPFTYLGKDPLGIVTMPNPSFTYS